MSKGSNSSGGGCGCISIIAACLFVWALVFGVTVGGKHYGFSGCDCNGVHVETGGGK